MHLRITSPARLTQVYEHQTPSKGEHVVDIIGDILNIEELFPLLPNQELPDIVVMRRPDRPARPNNGLPTDEEIRLVLKLEKDRLKAPDNTLDGAEKAERNKLIEDIARLVRIRLGQPEPDQELPDDGLGPKPGQDLPKRGPLDKPEHPIYNPPGPDHELPSKPGGPDHELPDVEKPGKPTPPIFDPDKDIPKPKK